MVAELRGHQLALQRALGREVAVDGPDADLGAPRDVVHLRRLTALGEQLAGSLDDPLAIADGIGPLGLGLRRAHGPHCSETA